MPAYNENLRQELELMESRVEQENMKKMLESLMGITELSDGECDALEAEFRKNNIFK